MVKVSKTSSLECNASTFLIQQSKNRRGVRKSHVPSSSYLIPPVLYNA